ncbi:MAG: flagellar protein export ATPase FliI [Syntrophales bacterium]|nr:flagellar protein export ATPase FliI [Syntrophales bacterium]
MDTQPKIDFAGYHHKIARVNPIQVSGKVTEIVGLIVEAKGLAATIGEVCRIAHGSEYVNAEVVGFRKGSVLLMPLDTAQGLSPGCKVTSMGQQAAVPVGESLLGRVLNGLGQPLDDKPPVKSRDMYPLYAAPLNPLSRARIKKPLDLGIRAINSLLTCGKGQRMGIFAGSGVGKSVLLGQIAKYSRADVNVIGLIGERGREVREFLEKNLGPEGMARSVVVVATSDTHPLIRMRAAYTATAIAEYFRDQGEDVLLMVDSLTRFAMAQREVGLSIGEPPTTRGYTPSVFSLMPRLLERSGALEDSGSITGLYTILVEGDDFNEPVSDTARSILDGHIMLTRDLAAKGHFPAIDILKSISRVMTDIVDRETMEAARLVIQILSVYRKAEDLINIGAYVSGSNPEIDYAINMIGRINSYLRQGMDEYVCFDDAQKELRMLFGN